MVEGPALCVRFIVNVHWRLIRDRASAREIARLWQWWGGFSLTSANVGGNARAWQQALDRDRVKLEPFDKPLKNAFARIPAKPPPALRAARDAFIRRIELIPHRRSLTRGERSLPGHRLALYCV